MGATNSSDTAGASAVAVVGADVAAFAGAAVAFCVKIPYITSGRIDLRETDTETAFRIINFLDEQKGTATLLRR